MNDRLWISRSYFLSSLKTVTDQISDVGLPQKKGRLNVFSFLNRCSIFAFQYVPPLDRTNSNFFAGKPFNRKVTSYCFTRETLTTLKTC